MKNEVIQLQPEDKDGFLKNISDLVKEYQEGNIECMVLAFRRKEEESTRTYFINRDDPHMFITLERLKHDILGLYSIDATSINEYDLEEE